MVSLNHCWNVFIPLSSCGSCYQGKRLVYQVLETGRKGYSFHVLMFFVINYIPVHVHRYIPATATKRYAPLSGNIRAKPIICVLTHDPYAGGVRNILPPRCTRPVLTPLFLELTVLAHQRILGTIVGSSQGIYEASSLSRALYSLKNAPTMIFRCQNYVLVV